ncbi:MAG: hypothetical protein MUR32_08980, partial [Planktomarina temperata]|uniref:hypothetical protein n=1 Tax=Planktomarina temperata TaxID=1284658 RepID=UPI0026F8D8F4|nr:hypothetical protein [Planktomarina temperata]
IALTCGLTASLAFDLFALEAETIGTKYDIFLIAQIFLTLGHSGSFSYLDAPGNASCGAILSDGVTSVTPIPNSNATLRAHIGTGREQWHSTGGQ